MKHKSFIQFFITILVIFLFISPAMAQEFTLDDNPNSPATGPFVVGKLSAEDPYGCYWPNAIGPSPSLLHANGPFMDSDILWIGPFMSNALSAWGFSYIDSISVDHSSIPTSHGPIGISFSIDRRTGGLPGTFSGSEASFNQQPADIYDTNQLFIHPGQFAGLANPAILPTAGGGGSNSLRLDDSQFGLSAPSSSHGTITPRGIMCNQIWQGTHDNIASYNHQVGVTFQTNTFFTVAPAETALTGLNSSDIGAIFPGGAPALYALASTLGLMAQRDSIDALIVWDNGTPLLLEPGVDYALFSLAPCSQTLFNWVGPGGQTIDAGAILFTDFTGTFSVYLFSPDLGLAPAPGQPSGVENVDAMDMY
jgi:hypothetical protein